MYVRASFQKDCIKLDNLLLLYVIIIITKFVKMIIFKKMYVKT